MRKIAYTNWKRVEGFTKNQYYKIGYYDIEKNCFVEVARFRNSYNKNSGANYGLLQIWSRTFCVEYFDKQKGYDYAGGYDKPDANLSNCLYQLKCDIEDNKIVTDCGELVYSSCSSVTRHIDELKDYLQKQYIVKLFVMDCNG